MFSSSQNTLVISSTFLALAQPDTRGNEMLLQKKNVTFGIPFHFPIIGELKREVLGLLNIQLRRKLGWGQNG